MCYNSRLSIHGILSSSAADVDVLLVDVLGPSFRGRDVVTLSLSTAVKEVLW